MAAMRPGAAAGAAAGGAAGGWASAHGAAAMKTNRAVLSFTGVSWLNYGAALYILSGAPVAALEDELAQRVVSELRVTRLGGPEARAA